MNLAIRSLDLVDTGDDLGAERRVLGEGICEAQLRQQSGEAVADVEDDAVIEMSDDDARERVAPA
jgi:hypothetical protein